jgi:hypothetical protein
VSFYDPRAQRDGFPVDLQPTTDLLARFHRTIMDRRHDLDWSFDAGAFTTEQIELARAQWSHRAVAEYESTAQFAQLLHRLTRMGAPIEIIGAATRLATDECRHAELCAKLAELFGGNSGTVTQGGLSLYDDLDDPMLQCVMTILAVCCFGETLSVPMFRALTVVTTEPVARRVVEVIAGDEEYHSRFGWSALGWFVAEMTDEQKTAVADRLPGLMSHFESVCFGSPEVLDHLSNTEFAVEPGEPNLGTLPEEGYAAIFYATMDETIIPQLDELGFDGLAAWDHRLL